MRKRLRKKKHLGEFKKWGTSITINRTTCDDFDPFLDNFIEQAIEENRCSFRGGGMDDSFEGIIQSGTISKHSEGRLKAIKGWLDCRTDIEHYMIGNLIDLWYGPFEKCDSIENVS